MLNDMKKIPEYIVVSLVSLWCPRCKAKPGIACDMLDNVVELIHLERIEAAISLDEIAKKTNQKRFLPHLGLFSFFLSPSMFAFLEC
jgi:hypothetical protein